jgi:hypothetical protein
MLRRVVAETNGRFRGAYRLRHQGGSDAGGKHLQKRGSVSNGPHGEASQQRAICLHTRHGKKLKSHQGSFSLIFICPLSLLSES